MHSCMQSCTMTTSCCTTELRVRCARLTRLEETSLDSKRKVPCLRSEQSPHQTNVLYIQYIYPIFQHVHIYIYIHTHNYISSLNSWGLVHVESGWPQRPKVLSKHSYQHLIAAKAPGNPMGLKSLPHGSPALPTWHVLWAEAHLP